MLNHDILQFRSPVRASALHRQSGVFLLEGLIAILIFSLGILGIIGLQAKSLQQVTDAKYRIDAANLADQLVGAMWIDAHATADLTNHYASPDGDKYQAWEKTVAATLPGVGVDGVPKPAVGVLGDAGDASKSQVTIEIYWRNPGDKWSADDPVEKQYHRYVSVSQIR